MWNRGGAAVGGRRGRRRRHGSGSAQLELEQDEGDGEKRIELWKGKERARVAAEVRRRPMRGGRRRTVPVAAWARVREEQRSTVELQMKLA